MRFSLKTLLAVILLCALAIAAVTKLRSASAKRAQEAALIATITRHNGSMKRAIAKGRDLGYVHGREDLQAAITQQKELTVRLTNAFNEFAAQVKVEPVENRISILERPVILRPRVYRRVWLVHVPNVQRAALRVDFVDEQDSTLNVSDEFVDQRPVTLPLPTGLCEVDAVFRMDEADFIVKIDGQEVARFERENKKVDGHASRNYSALQQQEYDPKSDDSPALMLIWPSPGTTGIRVRIIPDANE